MIQAIVYTVLILSFGCLAFGYSPMLIPALLWLYATFARERAGRMATAAWTLARVPARRTLLPM